MTEYVAVVYQVFSGGEDGANDAWAEGNADWIVDQCASLADQASLVDPEGMGEATSYAMVLRREADGSLIRTGKGFHLDDDGDRVDEPPPDGSVVDGA